MNPRLVGLAGPLQGNVYPLPQNEVSVGRESSNQLSISDATLSRRHCVFVPSQGGFQVRDLKSRNGTMVNGVPVDERQLEHGDQIWVGESAFVFLLDESENPQRSIVEFTETRDLGSLLLLRSDESYYLDLERVSAGPSVGRMARTFEELIGWLEDAVAGWNAAPTPFVWDGKRRERRRRARQRQLGGSAAVLAQSQTIAA